VAFQSHHFGAYVCNRCRAFWRRCVRRGRRGPPVAECQTTNVPYFDGMRSVCDITIFRGACQACRFAKCVAVGMREDSVLTEEDRAGKYARGQRVKKKKKNSKKTRGTTTASMCCGICSGRVLSSEAQMTGAGPPMIANELSRETERCSLTPQMLSENVIENLRAQVAEHYDRHCEAPPVLYYGEDAPCLQSNGVGEAPHGGPRARWPESITVIITPLKEETSHAGTAAGPVPNVFEDAPLINLDHALPEIEMGSDHGQAGDLNAQLASAAQYPLVKDELILTENEVDAQPAAPEEGSPLPSCGGVDAILDAWLSELCAEEPCLASMEEVNQHETAAAAGNASSGGGGDFDFLAEFFDLSSI